MVKTPNPTTVIYHENQLNAGINKYASPMDPGLEHILFSPIFGEDVQFD